MKCKRRSVLDRARLDRLALAVVVVVIVAVVVVFVLNVVGRWQLDTAIVLLSLFVFLFFAHDSLCQCLSDLVFGGLNLAGHCRC